jgi:eukaryotic-like serine/threonine-protein kinase
VTVSAPPEQPQDRIGQYELVQLLGAGGMGEVWLAVREGTDFRQHVALKIVRPGMESAEMRAGLRAERQILASLNHPNITHLLDVGETADGRPYLALEFVEGSPITTYCDARHLTTDERLRLFRVVCDAVRYAHQSLVIHHDLKPSNILVTKDGVPKLLDFGIAKVLSPEFGAGPRLRPSGHARLFTPSRPDPNAARRVADDALTPGYAAPEQLEGRATTTAADIYSLGVILYELMSGHRPYHTSGLSRADLLRRIREDNVPPPSVAAGSRALAGDIDAIVRRAMAQLPEQRYSSVEQLMTDIDRTLASQPVSARPRTARYVVERFVRRNRVGVTLGALGGVVLTVFVATVLRQSAAIRERERVVSQNRDTDPSMLAFTYLGAALADKGDARAADSVYAAFIGSRGDLVAAESLLTEMADRWRHVLGPDHLLVSDAVNGLGNLYLRSGDPRRAIALYAAALAIRRKRLAPKAPGVAQSLFNLAAAYVAAGDTAAAQQHYKEALAIRVETLGPNDPSTKAVRDAIATLSTPSVHRQQ